MKTGHDNVLNYLKITWKCNYCMIGIEERSRTTE